MKKAGLTALATILTVAAASPSQANGYRYHYRHGYCGYALHYDYSHASFLSPASYIFPVANWGRFFQCHVYYGPVVYLPGYDP